MYSTKYIKTRTLQLFLLVSLLHQCQRLDNSSLFAVSVYKQIWQCLRIFLLLLNRAYVFQPYWEEGKCTCTSHWFSFFFLFPVNLKSSSLKLRQCLPTLTQILCFLLKSPWTGIFAGLFHSLFGFRLSAHTHHTFRPPPLLPLPLLCPAAPELSLPYHDGPAFGLISYWASSSSSDCCWNLLGEARSFGSLLWKVEAPWIPFPGLAPLGCL